VKSRKRGKEEKEEFPHLITSQCKGKVGFAGEEGRGKNPGEKGERASLVWLGRRKRERGRNTRNSARVNVEESRANIMGIKKPKGDEVVNEVCVFSN